MHVIVTHTFPVVTLLCPASPGSVLFPVVVDGVEWHSVKFFQLSSQWQTHLKNFPVAIFTSIDAF